MGALGMASDLSLAARAGGRRAVFDFSGGVLPAGATLTRGSAGMRYAASGLLASEAADVARFDHHPVSHALRGLLIEEARTNDYAYSGELENGGWSPSAIAVTANAGISPDGSGNADLLVPSTANSGHSISRSATLTAGAGVVMSAFLKPAGYGFVQLYGNAGYSSFAWNIDLANASEAAFSAGSSVVTGRGIVPLGNGWLRAWIALTATTSGTAKIFAAVIASGAAARGSGFAGDGTSGVLAWGLQHEGGASVTSHVATGASAGTRAADALVLDWGSRGVADGAISVRYGFDDGSSQDVATTVSGGVAAVPTTLARRWILRAEKL